ncbi:SprT-like domain-containing protein [Pleurocapsa sp. PCC 7319]|uniref:SprT-like domain-containing protein n=1 Tax=Pleurocapsa sp. PCC 7319 TaxID=118161 RepID=UPI00034BF393|nr:SprT-like domain-containing protein [Pleurocapsa sp. PCC 7319]
MVRIKGIVKTAERVKNQLQHGIDPQEVDSLKAFVLNSLHTIEQICTEAKTTPDSLTTRSRKAYYYLKSIDWHNLPLTERSKEEPTSTSVSTPPPTLRIKNIVKQQKNIQQQIGQLKPDRIDSQLESIGQALTDCIREIDRICQQNQLTPAALTTPSRKAYAWMKFLTDRDNLKLHIQTTQRIKTLAHRAIKAQKSNISEIQVTITNYNGLYKYKHNRQGTIELQLSEGFIQAEDKILEAIINTAIQGNNPQDKQLIRHFSSTEAYSDIILELDLIADLDAETPQGNYYDLEALFHLINQEYFAGEMAKPRLTWNKTLTHRKLGHYEPLRDRVVMSRTLDSDRVPQIVVELVLYHELLHKHHGAKLLNGKRMVHTPEFRRSERQFQHYQEAQQWLERSLALAM